MLVLRHAASGETWTLSEGRLIVARKDALAHLHLEPGEAPLALDDELVSRRHAGIEAEAGRFWITDLDSRDGTSVNEREIHQRTPLEDGDSLRFGDSVLSATIERSTSRATSPRGQIPVEETFQNRPAVAPTRKVDPEKTMFQEPPVVSAPVADAAAPFTPVPTGATTQQRPQQRPATPSAAVSSSSGAAAPVTPSAAVSSSGATSPITPSVAVSPTPVTAPVRPPAGASPGQERAAATPSGGPRLDDVAASLRQLQREAASAVDRFEQAGGSAALESFLALSARLQSSIVSREDMDALLKQLPAVCRLLEVELQLIEMVSTRASGAPR